MEGWVALFDPDCEFVSGLEDSVEGGRRVYRGHEGLQAFLRETWATWGSFHVQVDRTERLGRTVLAEGSFRAQGRASGAELESQAWWVNKYRGERIIWSQAFLAREEAVKAASD
jgi:ketosteroid isomerase-like protein